MKVAGIIFIAIALVAIAHLSLARPQDNSATKFEAADAVSKLLQSVMDIDLVKLLKAIKKQIEDPQIGTGVDITASVIDFIVSGLEKLTDDVLPSQMADVNNSVLLDGVSSNGDGK